MDYIRRAYFIFIGKDIRRLSPAIQQSFALLPPEAEWHDISGDFTPDDFDSIEERHNKFGLDYGHDFSLDCEANRLIDAAVAALSDDSPI